MLEKIIGDAIKNKYNININNIEYETLNEIKGIVNRAGYTHMVITCDQVLSEDLINILSSSESNTVKVRDIIIFDRIHRAGTEISDIISRYVIDNQCILLGDINMLSESSKNRVISYDNDFNFI